MNAVARQILYLSREEVAAVGPSMGEIIEVLERMFLEKAAGRTEMPPKPGIHPQPDAFLHAMPAYIPALGAAGMKWVSGFPENSRRGVPYINGLLILNDPQTGLPLCVMDGTWITAQRTAAASALAARYLARADSRTLGVLGCGLQGRTHVHALQSIFELERVFAFDTNPTATQEFCQEIQALNHLQVTPVTTPRQAVSGCDLVVTAGPSLAHPHATIRAGWLDEGAFASLVDFDSYWHPDALAEITKFCTDDMDQFDHYRKQGYFGAIPRVHAELAELIAGTKTARSSDRERTAACNLGIALEDMAVAPIVYHRAEQQGIGTSLYL